MAKQGIFDTSARKIVGVLDSDDCGVVIVNGSAISLLDALDSYKGCEITINVGETTDSLTDD